MTVKVSATDYLKVPQEKESPQKEQDKKTEDFVKKEMKKERRMWENHKASLGLK